MQFKIPTSKDEMYEVLQDIFYYYRIKRAEMEEIDLAPLVLDKMEYTPLSTEQIKSMAESLVLPENQKARYDAKQKISLAISNMVGERESVELSNQKILDDITALYQAQIDKINKEAIDRGVQNSTIVVQEISNVESIMNGKLTIATQEGQEKLALIDGEIASLRESLNNVDAFYDQLYIDSVSAKIIELTSADKDKQDEVFKYNNNLMEKELKYSNEIIRRKADLRLKYQEVQVEFYSKDQLIEMGYYAKVVECIRGYYDTLNAVTAYQDIKAEKKLMIYLEDYYQSVLYLYSVLANE